MSIYIKRKSRESLCEVLPVVGDSWRHIGMYASHAAIGLNINARWWLGSHHLLCGSPWDAALCWLSAVHVTVFRSNHLHHCSGPWDPDAGGNPGSTHAL